MDKDKSEPYLHNEDFKGENLLECRSKALNYYQKRLEEFRLGEIEFLLPFASPENFKIGENTAFSLTLSLIEYYSEDDQYENPIAGEDEDLITEGLEIEASILAEKGLTQE